MKPLSRVAAVIGSLLMARTAVAGGPPSGPLTRCPPDAVVSGSGCIDKYEASVWRVPNATGTNRGVVTRIQQGAATVTLLAAAGATRLGLTGADYAPCATNGQNCANDIFAVSLPDVTPSASISWFQAQQACRNSGKRLPSNAEWQVAVADTPDPGPDDGSTDCNSAGSRATPTGSRRRCVSSRGAFDMVGNLNEWVAEWLPQSTVCGSWDAGVSSTGDFQCLSGAATEGDPGALVRGGSFLQGANAGPLAIFGYFGPTVQDITVGFRCAR